MRCLPRQIVDNRPILQHIRKFKVSYCVAIEEKQLLCMKNNGTILPSVHATKIMFNITGINPEAILMVGDHYDHPLCPGFQPGPPSQTPGGLGQKY